MILKPSPQAKLLLYLIVLIAAVILKNYKMMLGIIILSSVLAVILLKWDLKNFFLKFLIMIPLFSFLIGLFAIFNFITPGDIVLRFTDTFYVTDKGLRAFLNFYLRILTISSISGLYIMNTKGGEFLKGLKWLKIPGEIILIFSLTLRYIEIFSRDVSDFLVAKKLRIFNPMGTIQEIRWTGSRAFLLMSRGIKESIDVSKGLALRGATEDIKYPAPEPINGLDLIFIMTMALIAAGFVVIDRNL